VWAPWRPHRTNIRARLQGVSVLWILPLVVVTAGVVVVTAATKRTAAAATALQQESARLEELRTALTDLRAARDATTAKAAGLRRRSDRGGSRQ